MVEQGLAEQIFTAPWIWLLFSLVVIYFIVTRWKKGDKPDPSTKPFWGRTVRREVMKKETEKRFGTLGKNCKIILEKGVARIGMITAIEYDKMLMYRTKIDEKTRQRKYLPDYYYRVDRFKVRKLGAFARLKAFFGFGYFYMTVTPDSYATRVDKNKRIFNIDPTVHILNDSDVWTVANPRAMNANDEYILKAHDENIHGSDIDFLRRLAVHSPSVASTMEKDSHLARLKEEERKNKTAAYS